MYPVEIISEGFRPFYGLNPMYQFVDYFRDLALRGVVPDLWSNMVCSANKFARGFALSALCVGTYVFMRQQDRYILYL
jgi:ABC-type polysaccharide/polyol phosphate export permease